MAKTNADRSHDVFVESIKSGAPADGVTVQVLGRNGLPVVSATTSADGHAHLPRLRYDDAGTSASFRPLTRLPAERPESRASW